MIVAIHQPNFAPWLGYFHKMQNADVFVLLDDVPISRRGYTRRVKIQGDRWLSVPVHSGFTTPINEITLADEDFAASHHGILRAAYGPSPELDEFVAAERRAVAESDLLVDLNLAVLEHLRVKLAINTKMIRSSELDVQGTSTERLVSIVSQLGGDIYLSGSGGRSYQDEDLFEHVGIALRYDDFAAADVGEGTGYSALHSVLARVRS